MKNFLTTQKALRSLIYAAQTDSRAGAYIFEGMRGIGKSSAAMIFAAALHCTGEKVPCLNCPDCKKVFAHTHPDVYITGEDGAVRVNDIRALTEELYIKPAISKNKVLIVKNADSMNSDAQNALLKSFEEPPSYAVIILLSENVQNLLPTIRSRGMHIVFEPFSEEETERFVKAQYPQKSADANFIAQYSGGIIGRAIDICEDEGFFALRQKMFEAISHMTGDRTAIFEVAELFDIKKSGKAAFLGCDMYFDLFLSFMGDVSALKLNRQVINKDLIVYIEEFSKKTAQSAVISVIERVTKQRSMLNVSMKYELWIVNMLIKCWEDIHGRGSRS